VSRFPASEALARMRAAVGDDDEIIADILQSFVDEADGLVADLSTAALASDFRKVGMVAHTIKTSALDLGHSSLAKLCAALEYEARAGAVHDVVEKAQAIVNDCLALKEGVARYIATLQDNRMV
jgi:histidine phosphotransfer protein HptB